MDSQGHQTDVPNILYDGYPELKVFDRHVAAILLRYCPEPGWYPFSLREIAAVSGVSHNLLRSIEGREGILNRLQRVTKGMFDFLDGIAISPLTGNKKGQPLTCIGIDHDSLWQANAAFFARKPSPLSPDLLTREMIAIPDITYEIYRILNPYDGSIYVGLSKDAYERFKQHQDKESRLTPWFVEMQQNGTQPILEIIETAVGIQQARQRERYWIEHYSQNNVLVNYQWNKRIALNLGRREGTSK